MRGLGSEECDIPISICAQFMKIEKAASVCEYISMSVLRSYIIVQTKGHGIVVVISQFLLQANPAFWRLCNLGSAT